LALARSFSSFSTQKFAFTFLEQKKPGKNTKKHGFWLWLAHLARFQLKKLEFTFFRKNEWAKNGAYIQLRADYSCSFLTYKYYNVL
jgi:hypothetical protein